MNFTVANHNSATNPTNFIHYNDVEFTDISEMTTCGYCYCACKLKDNYRLDTNFLGEVDVLIIDIDENCTIAQAQILFKKYEYFIITSKSHNKDKGGLTCERFRIFFHLDKTVNNKKHMEDVYQGFIDLYPFVDIKCKNVSRFFYSSPANAQVIYNKGIRYKTNICHSVISIGVEDENDHQPIPKVTSDTIYRYSEVFERWQTDDGDILECENNNQEENHLKGIQVFLDTEFYQGNKGHCLFNASCIMKKDGFSEDFIIDYLIKEWNNRSASSDKFKDALQNIKGGLKY